MGKIYDKASIIIPQGAAYETNRIYAAKPLTDNAGMEYVRTSAATRITDCGEIKQVAANIPQYDYINGEAWLKLEKESTNLDKNSHGFTASGSNINPLWQENQGSVSNNTVVSPESKINGHTLTLTGGTNWDFYTRYNSLTNGTKYTWSCYVKLGTATNFCVVPNNTTDWNVFNSESGAVKRFTSADGLSTTEWTRVSVSFTVDSNAAINLHLGAHSNSSISAQDAGTVYIWGIQLEEGYIPTSLIKTTGAAATRPQSHYHNDDFKSGFEFKTTGWSYATKIKWDGQLGNGGNVKRFADLNYTQVWYVLEPYNNSGTATVSLAPVGTVLASAVNFDKFIVYRYNGHTLSVYNDGNLLASGVTAQTNDFVNKDRYGASGFVGHIGDELYFNQILSEEEAIELSKQ